MSTGVNVGIFMVRTGEPSVTAPDIFSLNLSKGTLLGQMRTADHPTGSMGSGSPSGLESNPFYVQSIPHNPFALVFEVD